MAPRGLTPSGGKSQTGGMGLLGSKVVGGVGSVTLTSLALSTGWGDLWDLGLMSQPCPCLAV